MSAPAGQYGGLKYESPQTRALASITTESYEKVYDDEAQFLAKLANDTSYMAQTMRTMQQGIDQADENIVQQIQGFINEIQVVMGGQGDTGFDFGDFKYVLEAIGSLFGFTDDNGNYTIPINLFEAAWHFFSNYVMPTGNFEDMFNSYIDEAMDTMLDVFGEVPIVGQEVEQVAEFISIIRDDLDPIIEALQALFNAFNVNIDDPSSITNLFGPYSGLLDALTGLFQDVNIPDFTPIFEEMSQWDQPFIDALVAVINSMAQWVTTVNSFESSLYGSGVSPTDLGSMLTDMWSMLGQPGLGLADFDPLVAGAQQLENILVPSGALTSWTSIPVHLLDSLFPGNINGNLLPDPSFDDASYFDGQTLWTFDATTDHTGKAGSGSAKTTCAGVIRQLIGVPIKQVSPGNTIDVSVYTKYTGVSSIGQTIVLAVNAYDASDNQIFDGNRVIDSIGSLEGDADWTQLSGTYTIPANTSYVRLCLEVTAAALAGSVWFDDASMMVESGLFDAGLLANIENIPQIFMDSVENLPDLFTGFGNLGNIFGTINIDDPINSTIEAITTWWSGDLGPNSLSGLISGNSDLIADAESALTQIGDIFSGGLVTPISTAVSDIKSWFSGSTGPAALSSGIGTNSSGITSLNGVISEIGAIFNGAGASSASSAVNQILSWWEGSSGPGSLLSSIGVNTSGLSTTNSALNQIGQVFNNQVVTPINTAISDIISWWGGTTGPAAHTTAISTLNTKAQNLSTTGTLPVGFVVSPMIRLRRVNTATVSLTTGADNAVPYNFYDTVDYNYSNGRIVMSTSGNFAFTVLDTGVYDISLAFLVHATGSGTEAAIPALYVNGAAFCSGQEFAYGAAIGSVVLGASFPGILLNANDYVWPMIESVSDTLTVSGTANGVSTWISIRRAG